MFSSKGRIKFRIYSFSLSNLSILLINCSIPEAIESAFITLSSNFECVGAYANGFTSVDALEPGGTVESLHARKDLDPKNYFVMVKKNSDALNLSDLSMGMSSDFEEAIICGSTYLRLGSIIFGERKS